MPIYVPLLFMAVPVVIVAIFVAIVRGHRRQARAVNSVPSGWIWTKGMVIDERTGYERYGRLNTDGTFVRRPIVSFRDAEGREFSFLSSISASFMPRPGTEVGVCYPPAEPASARISPDSIPRANAVVSGIAYTMFLIIGIPVVAILELVGVFLLRTR